MGKSEAWEVTGRTDETMTLLYKRRVYNEGQYPLSTGGGHRKKEGRSQQMDDGLDPETRAVLKKLSDLNARIRQVYRFDSNNPKKLLVDEKDENEEKEMEKEYEKMKKKKEKIYSKKAADQESSASETVESVDDEKLENEMAYPKAANNSEPCDHRGVPLSHPMAMTPYPGATTAAQREKARKMLKEIAREMHEEDMRKKKEMEKSIEKTTKSSDKTSEKSSKSSTKASAKKTGSETSKNSKSSNKKMGCDKCGSCQKCIHRCSRKHTAEQKVTDEEREKFLKSIKRLRKKIMKPEKSREKASKSPYDITQSESEIDLSSTSSKSKKGSKKKSQE